MTYPERFTPTRYERFSIGHHQVHVPKSVVTFHPWTGEPVKETFGGKPIINHGGRPVFAELAIMLTFRDDAWDARWVETYGRKEPIFLADWKDDKYANQVHQPFEDHTVRDLIAAIATINQGSYAGCWDVVARKGGQILFAESKRAGKDRIRESQVQWLASALAYGLSPDNFLLVQWDLQGPYRTG